MDTQTLLRFVPPPSRLQAPLRLLPAPFVRTTTQRLLERVLAGPFATGVLDDMAGRTLGVEVTDLGLRWVVRVGNRRLERVEVEGEAEATVRGTATDLLLLAARLEDADTLFFHRRLQLTGDVELGLAIRNLLDQLPWEAIPLGLRVALNRGARFARAARDAHQSEATFTPR
jgi:predicted lipid carrier protein YhbT